jgi:hypothetical protein
MIIQSRLVKPYPINTDERVHVEGPQKLSLGSQVTVSFLKQAPSHILTFQMYLVFPGGDDLILFDQVSLEVKPAWKNREIKEVCKQMNAGDDSRIGALVIFTNSIIQMKIVQDMVSTNFYLNMKVPTSDHDHYDDHNRSMKINNGDLRDFLTTN